MTLTYHGKQLCFYQCESGKGLEAIVMATSPEQARRELTKAKLGGYWTASLMGVIQPRPGVIYVEEER